MSNLPKHPDPQVQRLRDEYLVLCHAMQTGVKYDHETSKADDGSPKHLRVGVNVAMSDHAALVQLLLLKGVITEVEYYTAMVEGMRGEVRRYEALLSRRTGVPVTLA